MLRVGLYALAIGLAWLPLAASAAVTTVQYTITGGTSSGTRAIGTITGGTIGVSFPNTGSGPPPLTSVPTVTSVKFTGTGGAISFATYTLASINGHGLNGFRGTLRTLSAYWKHQATFTTGPNGSITIPFTPLRLLLNATFSGALTGSFDAGFVSLSSVHSNSVTFTGQEVQVPEPAPSALVSLGGALLAAYGWQRLRRA